eukprot:Hpha_TRINITY_DN15753_c0_g1::TRINITY_DN15753_c0_g1_i1::g.39240::m.39240
MPGPSYGLKELGDMQLVEDELVREHRVKTDIAKEKEERRKEATKALDAVEAEMRREMEDRKRRELERREQKPITQIAAETDAELEQRKMAEEALEQAVAAVGGQMELGAAAAPQPPPVEGEDIDALHNKLQETGALEAILMDRAKVEEDRAKAKSEFDAVVGALSGSDKSFREEADAAFKQIVDAYRDPGDTADIGEKARATADEELENVMRALQGGAPVQSEIERRRAEAQRALDMATAAVVEQQRLKDERVLKQRAAAAKTSTPIPAPVAPVPAPARAHAPAASGSLEAAEPVAEQRALPLVAPGKREAVDGGSKAPAPSGTPHLVLGTEGIATAALRHFCAAAGLLKNGPKVSTREGTAVEFTLGGAKARGVVPVMRALASRFPGKAEELVPFATPAIFAVADDAAETASRVADAVEGLMAILDAEARQGFSLRRAVGVALWGRTPSAELLAGVRRLRAAVREIDERFYRSGAEWADSCFLCDSDDIVAADFLLASALEHLRRVGLDVALLGCRRASEGHRRISKSPLFRESYPPAPQNLEGMPEVQVLRKLLRDAASAVSNE